MNPERIVYVSGPVTDIHDGNRLTFEATTKAIRNLGHIARNPHEFCADIPKDSDWEVFMRRGITQLMGCTDIIMLPKFKQSRGAMLELRLAQELGIRIYFGMHQFKLDHAFPTTEDTPNPIVQL